MTLSYSKIVRVIYSIADLEDRGDISNAHESTELFFNKISKGKENLPPAIVRITKIHDLMIPEREWNSVCVHQI